MSGNKGHSSSRTVKQIFFSVVFERQLQSIMVKGANLFIHFFEAEEYVKYHENLIYIYLYSYYL